MARCGQPGQVLGARTSVSPTVISSYLLSRRSRHGPCFCSPAFWPRAPVRPEVGSSRLRSGNVSALPASGSRSPAACPCPGARALIPRNCELADRDGEAIPAAFTVANRWWEDGSIKWVHVDRSAQPAGERGGDILTFGRASHMAPQTRDSVSETRGRDHSWPPVHCGSQYAARVRSVSAECRAFDGASALLADRPRGFHVSQGGRTAWASADAESVVTVEERNPFRVVIACGGPPPAPGRLALARLYHAHHGLCRAVLRARVACLPRAARARRLRLSSRWTTSG